MKHFSDRSDDRREVVISCLRLDCTTKACEDEDLSLPV